MTGRHNYSQLQVIKMKFDVKSLALTSGIVWGLALFMLAWWVIATGGGDSSTTALGQVYKGYAFSPMGSVIGLLWGFADGFIGGFVFAWLYNKISPAKTVEVA